MKAAFVLITVAVFALCGNARGQDPIDWYDCSSKPDGNYLNPYNCHGLIHCSTGYAFSEVCPPCIQHPTTCPEGTLRFNEQTGQCGWANEAPCNELPFPATTPRPITTARTTT
ncbi:unnamed protein product [Orchesella dallaii]|uniref:Chitin-binding type-2 domain-containing protein n=1 Tax=Orchesella dallaii TaxID=48710 RepID=A0ABP1RH94_9HEXA